MYNWLRASDLGRQGSVDTEPQVATSQRSSELLRSAMSKNSNPATLIVGNQTSQIGNSDFPGA
jgi:hypothetical protein